MIPPDALILLDTNVLIHLVRGKALGQRIDAEYQLCGRVERPIISVVTNGRPIGNNDLWIAACAAATNAWLLTCDKDFDYLASNAKLQREWVDPALDA